MTTTTTSRTSTAGLAVATVPDPWLRTTLLFPASRCGPPSMVNGGWVAGTVAGHLGDGPVEVTLRWPTPLESPVELRAADDDAALIDGGAVLVTARRSPGEVRPPAPVSWDEAREAADRYAGHHDHPFPGCFVCGPDRAEGDGLRLFTGPVAGRPGAVAGLLTPQEGHAPTTGGRVPRATVWAALDCPTAWPHLRPGVAALLVRMRAQVWSTVAVGGEYVAVGEAVGEDGRKRFSRSAVYDRAGTLVGAAEATWITVDGAP
jgi:hypothetical protein